MREIFIDGRRIADDEDCYFIAEIGHNHQGNVPICKEMFRAARDSGADAVKLQKRDVENLYTKAFYNSPYENENSYGPTYGKHREALEFNRDQYAELQEFARIIGITFFATAFDEASATVLDGLRVPAFKIASAECLDLPLLRFIAIFGKPMIISTAGATFMDLINIEHQIRQVNPLTPISFLQCTAKYPCGPEDVNLAAITQMMMLFPQLVIGLSDHTPGIVPAMGAYLMGARIIEKHFTLNRAWKGTDHKYSLEPKGFEQMVHNIQILKKSMGDGVKIVRPEEAGPLRKMARSIHVIRHVPEGKAIGFGDIALKTPADGLPAADLGNVIGKIAIRELSTSDALTWEDLK